MANSYRAGDAAGASLPYDSKFALMGVTGQLPDPRPAIDYHDAQIGRVALAHFLNLDGQGGSYALASTQADLFTTAVKSVAEMVRDAANRYIVEDLVDWNFGKPLPRRRSCSTRSASLRCRSRMHSERSSMRA